MLVVFEACASSQTSAASATGIEAGRGCRPGRPIVTADTSIAESGHGPSTFRSLATTGPEYPKRLRDENVSGVVRASFTVDTLGNVVWDSAVINEETHRDFGTSVCMFLRRLRMTPFEANGRRYSVRIVQQEFTFEVFR